MSGVGGLLELYWNFIGVDRNFIGTVSLRYCYVIATLLLRYRYVIGRRSRVPDLRSVPLCLARLIILSPTAFWR